MADWKRLAPVSKGKSTSDARFLGLSDLSAARPDESRARSIDTARPKIADTRDAVDPNIDARGYEWKNAREFSGPVPSGAPLDAGHEVSGAAPPKSVSEYRPPIRDLARADNYSPQFLRLNRREPIA